MVIMRIIKFTKNAEKDKRLLKGAGLEVKVKNLLNLIATKHPELFKKYEIKPKKVDKNLYKENTIYKIDIMTGDNDINLYQLINVLLSDVNHLTMSSAFNYNAVKSKIESIKKGIELSMQQLDLLP